MAYNSSTATSIRILLYFANYRQHLTAYYQKRDAKVINQAALISVTKLKGIYQRLTEEIIDTYNLSAKYYDKKHVTGPTFLEGDMVYINCKNIKTKRPSNKLDYV